MQPLTAWISVLVACFLLLPCAPETASQTLGDTREGEGTRSDIGTFPTASRPEAMWPKTLRNTIGMEFVVIPAGEFLMGISVDEMSRLIRLYGFSLKREWIEDEMPQHRVRISRPFYLGKYEVTQGQWEAVMGNNPSRFKGENRPVETISWEDVQAFIRRLNTRESGVTYRLPTEAEWEYAARGDDGRRYPRGNQFDPSRLNLCGQNCASEWKKRTANDGDGGTASVGSYEGGQSSFGVYDMAGNTWEWVQDVYGPYAAEPVTDPQGPATGPFRVIRGGSWDNDPGLCRTTSRLRIPPDHRFDFLGFRLLRTAP